ncbi:MAG: leucine-rich repeat domain-containing protein, partial [Lachnospiraceae bacterium]|nr:leucine-rich repeat domain-containing protein [Lachnospiraceae bacterium]
MTVGRLRQEWNPAVFLLIGSVLGVIFGCYGIVTQSTVSAEESTVVQSAVPAETETPDVYDSPYIGENGVYAEWSYDKQTQCLTICGNGETHSEKSAKTNNDGKFEYANIPRPREGSDRVKEIKIMDGVTAISSAAFVYYSNLEKVTIPDSVQSIGNYVFYECKSLKEIRIPDGVQSIGKECFFGCTALEKVSFGKNMTDLGEAALGGCTSLSQVNVSAENPYLRTKNGIFYNTAQKILYVYYANKSNFTIDKGIKIIGAYAFAKNKKLKTIKIPASVTEIGGAAFYQCKNLQKVSFAKKSKCKMIKDYIWRDGDIMHHGCFQGCKKLKQMIFPEALKYIDYWSLGECSSLKKLHFGKAFLGANNKNPEIFMSYYDLQVSAYSVSKGNKRFSSKNGVLYNKKKTRLLYYP